MSIGALDAASAYGRVLNVGGGTKPFAPSSTDGAEGGSFGSMVEGMVTNTGDALRTAEKASAAQVAGKGDLIDVVTAIGAAETALDTMVAVRDRVVSAYTDIMRMQI
ncbi:flagellar hook-basal body complex protein FliE [Sphingomonas sp.]|uniref:flagellar hook-basal body complex protein FliE n=1 Tax=Sphingomonas sp. TaxID=28214 RepID=UPI001B0FAB67|nr:flagellar hook-basal body complex protein FliE [Sphingomonas sp.]MBO9713482.1 flagellar hook-basal body complex protein FliE [Sphingomonas sp.]